MSKLMQHIAPQGLNRVFEQHVKPHCLRSVSSATCFTCQDSICGRGIFPPGSNENICLRQQHPGIFFLFGGSEYLVQTIISAYSRTQAEKFIFWRGVGNAYLVPPLLCACHCGAGMIQSWIYPINALSELSLRARGKECENRNPSGWVIHRRAPFLLSWFRKRKKDRLR